MFLYNVLYSLNTQRYISTVTLYEGESKENVIFLKFFYHGLYGVLIRDSYPDVRLFQSLLEGDFLTR